MRTLSPPDILTMWEYGDGLPLVQRAVHVLACVHPEQTLDELARWSIGKRDALLFNLHEYLFGPRFIGITRCQDCGQQVEFDFLSKEMFPATGDNKEAEVLFETEGYAVRFRFPTSMDLMAVQDVGTTEQMRNQLFERCLLDMKHRGIETPLDKMPDHVVNAVIEQMEKTDSFADVQLTLSCPSCTKQWRALFDIVSFLWSEINAWARQVLLEVHLLAKAYGWGETEILAMSPHRRKIYLEMATP